MMRISRTKTNPKNRLILALSKLPRLAINHLKQIPPSNQMMLFKQMKCLYSFRRRASSVTSPVKTSSMTALLLRYVCSIRKNFKRRESRNWKIRLKRSKKRKDKTEQSLNQATS
jgi:hypothetical protein